LDGIGCGDARGGDEEELEEDEEEELEDEVAEDEDEDDLAAGGRFWCANCTGSGSEWWDECEIFQENHPSRPVVFVWRV